MLTQQQFHLTLVDGQVYEDRFPLLLITALDVEGVMLPDESETNLLCILSHLESHPLGKTLGDEMQALADPSLIFALDPPEDLEISQPSSLCHFPSDFYGTSLAILA